MIYSHFTFTLNIPIETKPPNLMIVPCMFNKILISNFLIVIKLSTLKRYCYSTRISLLAHSFDLQP